MEAAQTHEEIGAEARRVVAAATDRGEVLRIAGGVAYQLRVAGRVALPRAPLGDIDLIAPAKRNRRVAALLTEIGYTPEKEFNARHGDRRLIFWDLARERKLEVFVGTFVMCHELPIAERLEVEPETVPLAELLLTKLQIVELNEKDADDCLRLLVTFPLEDSDDAGAIDLRVFRSLVADDWGWWRTVTLNLERISALLNGGARPAIEGGKLDARTQLQALSDAAESAPKSRRWKMRARIGERKRWYDVPEETPHE
jgi:hypothetical protein